MRGKDTLGLCQILSYTKHEMRLQMDEVLGDLGLSAAQYGVLSTLEEQDRLTNAELARACYVTPQTMIRIIRSLEERGFVLSSESAEHGLKIEFQLTKVALDVLCKAHVRIYELEKQMVKGFSETRVRQLIQTLKDCFENLNYRPGIKEKR